MEVMPTEDFEGEAHPAPPDVAVVLVHPRNPLNIGAVARAMSNFGFFDLRIAGAHPPNVEEARSAVDAAPLLLTAGIYSTTAEAVADCVHVIGTTTGKGRSLTLPLHALPMATRTLSACGKTALLFGSEKHGLSTDDLSFCSFAWHIPTRSGHLSMNLGQAAAICLYAIATSSGQARADLDADLQPAPVAAREKVLAGLLDLLVQAGYAGAQNSPVLHQKARRMTANLALNEQDSRLFLGMLRRISARLRKS